MGLKLTHASIVVEGKKIVHDVSIELNSGEVHALMGPNGSGKSTLAYALAGHPRYIMVKGKISIDGKDVTGLSPHERAKKGLFLSFQYPVEVPGVSVQNFLRQSYNALHDTSVDLIAFHKTILEGLKRLGMSEQFAKRNLNEGFSGGEKKRMEMLQLDVLRPKFAILDETDSGLDVDALRIVAKTVNEARARGTGILVITHYSRILEYIVPDHVHILVNGLIKKSGDKTLAKEVERTGYESLAAAS